MPQPIKHAKTGVYLFRKTVPEPLRPIVGRREIKISLRTKDPREAKLRYPEAAAKADAILQQARGGPIHLTQKQVFGLAGEWFRQELKQQEDDPGDPVVLDEQLWHLKDLRDESLTDDYRRFPEPADAPEFKSKGFIKEVQGDVDRLLAAQGLLVDDDTYERLSFAVFDKKASLVSALLHRARGDYRPTEEIEKAPPWERPAAQPPITGSGRRR